MRGPESEKNAGDTNVYRACAGSGARARRSSRRWPHRIRIERGTGGPDRGMMSRGPPDQPCQRIQQRVPERRQTVLDARGHGGKHLPDDQTVPLQVAQGLSEHAL
jgi:hypothetical protein